MTRPTFSTPPSLLPPTLPATLPHEQHPPTLPHRDNRSLDADRLPPKHHCRKLPGHRSHHRHRRLPIGLPRHTPYRPYPRAGLAHGMPINPTPLRLLELPIAGDFADPVPVASSAMRQSGMAQEARGRKAVFSSLSSSSSEEVVLVDFSFLWWFNCISIELARCISRC